MPSWRDETPQSVQDDLERIVSTALDAALTFLRKSGEFFPFGITLTTDGQAALAAGDPGLGQQPQSTAVLNVLHAGVQQNRDALRAAGFVANITANGGDAVRIEAEHRDGGPALSILMPYTHNGLIKKTVTYGQMTTGTTARRVWPER